MLGLGQPLPSVNRPAEALITAVFEDRRYAAYVFPAAGGDVDNPRDEQQFQQSRRKVDKPRHLYHTKCIVGIFAEQVDDRSFHVRVRPFIFDRCDFRCRLRTACVVVAGGQLVGNLRQL